MLDSLNEYVIINRESIIIAIKTTNIKTKGGISR